MANTGPEKVQRAGEPAGVKTPEGIRLRKQPVVSREQPGEQTSFVAKNDPDRLSVLPPPVRFATRAAAAVLALVSLLHLVFVFLHVAPANPISQRYARQVQSWIYPLFEQNWRLFAPDPESSVPRISARTESISADGSQQISGWLDLTAVDNAGVRHNPFPSHTTQNMLRRAWSGYLDTHGNSDVSSSPRAVMWQEYLRNIAVDRVSAAGHGAIEAIQLHVRTSPVTGLDAAGHSVPVALSAVQTRDLPWWKVTGRGH